MYKTKKIFAILLIVLMIGSIFSGCSNSVKNTSKTNDKENSVDNSKGNEDNNKTNEEEIVLKWAVEAGAADRGETQDLIKLAAEHGIKIKPWIMPVAKDGEADKLLISLMGGEEIDICYDAYPNMKRKINAGVVYPIEQLAADAGYNMKDKFGGYLPVFDDEVYGLPAFVDIGITLYNRNLFDKAGIEYPSAENWTWENYIKTAKKLTDESNGIYGSFMPTDWAHYNYFHAIQKGISHYKEEGTSNYDAPEFAEALKFNYDFGNLHKVQPDYLTMKSKQLPYDSFTTGKYGMFVCGCWSTSLMKDKEKYPRDWKFGILPMPYPEGNDKSTITVTGNYWIPTTSKKKEYAFKVISLFAEHQYELGYGKIPARVDISDEELDKYIEENLVEPFKEDGITVDDFRQAYFDPNMKVYPEKIVGYGDVAINQIFCEEGGLYGIGEKSLEDTMKQIKEKADKAIKDDMK
ncbi:MAG: extracellular solute-binding protein [Vallitalea sp.]|jgi:multiple sugar transport system substrate-binding protein|nr:extracellular solute-binding protein [Vallitalea sp.]